jgi:WD40 repeat protein
MNMRESTAEPRIPDHELLRVIGKGSYGEVWLARNIMGTYRAVKIVYENHFDAGRAFDREYSGLDRFEPVSRTHDSQLDVLHVGRQEGYFYYVMELADDQLTGQQIDSKTYRPKSLHSVLAERGSLSPDETMEIALALTTALQHLHNHSLIHRDIKPSNIIFVNGLPKLADIGLVSSADATRSFVGTEGYLPPEGPGTAQSDVYSLGKVLYETLTGRDRKDYPELPTDLAQLPDRQRYLELNSIISKACRADLGQRYSSAEEMRQDLLLAQSGKSVIRLRKMERRFALAMRLGLAATILLMIAGAGFLYEAKRSRTVAHLAEEVQRAEALNRASLTRLQVANANRLMREGKLSHALAWLVQALPNVQDDPEQEKVHRIRLGSILESHPRLTHQFLHDNSVSSCAFTPDNKRLVTVMRGGRLSLFDLETRKLLYSVEAESGRSWFGPRAYSPALFFSPDGERVILRALERNQPTEIFRLSDGQQLNPPKEKGFLVLDSINGRVLLVSGTNSSVQLLDLETGHSLSPAVSVPGQILTGRLSEDSRTFAIHYIQFSPENYYVQLWTGHTGEPIGPPLAIDFEARYLLSRDGSKLAADANHSFDSPPRVFETATGRILSTNSNFRGKTRIFIVSPAGQWIVMQPSANQKQLWNLETGQSIDVELDENIRHIASTQDGLLLAAVCDSGEAILIDGQTGAIEGGRSKHAQWAHGAAFTTDGRFLATCSEDRSARIWDLAAAELPKLQINHNSPVTSAAYTPDGEKILSLSFPSAELRCFDSRSGQLISPIVTETGARNGQTKFSPDGTQFVSFGAPKVRDPFGNYVPSAWIWRTDALSEPPIRIELEGVVQSADWKADGTRIATVNTTGRAHLWESASGALLHTFDTNFFYHYAAFLSSSDEVVTCSSNGVVRAWDAATGKLTRTWQLADPAVPRFDALQVSPNGRYLAAGARDQRAYLWDLEFDKRAFPPVYQGGVPLSVTFSPDSRFLVTWGPASFVKVWRVGEDQPAIPPLVHRGEWIHTVEISKDGRRIVTSSQTGDASIWDARTGELLRVPSFHPGGASAAAIHPQRDEFLTAGADGALRVWSLAPVKHSRDELSALTELYFFNRIDSTGFILPLSAEKMGPLFEELVVRKKILGEVSPRHAGFWYWRLASKASKAGQAAPAIEYLNRALALAELSPGNSALFSERGYAHAILGNYDQAASDFAKATASNPLDINLWQFRWQIALGLGRRQEMVEIVQAALAKFSWATTNTGPHVVPIRLTLGAMLGSLRPEEADPKVGLEVLQFEFPVHRAARQFARAQLLSQANRFDEAIPLFRQVFNAWPVQARMCLALTEQRAGKTEAARATFNEALRWQKQEPTPPDRWTERLMHRSLIEEARLLGLSAE